MTDAASREANMTPNPTRQQIFTLAEKAGFSFVDEDRNETPWVLGHHGNCAEELMRFAVLVMELKEPQVNEWRNAYHALELDTEERRCRYAEQREQLFNFETKARRALARLEYLIDEVAK
jgi:hypothetical protein